MQATLGARVGAHRLRLPRRPDALHPGRRDAARRPPTRPSRAGAPPRGLVARRRRSVPRSPASGWRSTPACSSSGWSSSGSPSSSGRSSPGPTAPAPTPSTTTGVRGRLMHPLEFPVAGLLVRRAHRVRLLPGDGRPLQGRRHRRVRRRRRDRHGPRGPARHPAEGLADRRRRGPQRLRHHRPRGRRGRHRGRGAVLPRRTRTPAPSGRSGSLTVSAKSGVAGTISFDGSAFDPDTFVAGRNAVLTVIFKNLSDEEAKFVVHAGERSTSSTSRASPSRPRTAGRQGPDRVLHRPRPARHAGGAHDELHRAWHVRRSRRRTRRARPTPRAR